MRCFEGDAILKKVFCLLVFSIIVISITINLTFAFGEYECLLSNAELYTINEEIETLEYFLNSSDMHFQENLRNLNALKDYTNNSIDSVKGDMKLEPFQDDSKTIPIIPDDLDDFLDDLPVG